MFNLPAIQCPVVGCYWQKITLTGFQELFAIKKHMLKKHGIKLNMEDALRYREYTERKQGR